MYFSNSQLKTVWPGADVTGVAVAYFEVLPGQTFKARDPPTRLSSSECAATPLRLMLTPGVPYAWHRRKDKNCL